MRSTLALLIVVLCLLATASYAQPVKTRNTLAADAKLVDVGGHKLWMESAGKGGPTVVLDYGLGGPTNTWRTIFPRIAEFTRVIRYDRAGYGKSEAGPHPRSFRQVASEMHAMLRNANVPGPYVLVGHSLGNAHIRAFADMYPNDVAGMVFIDPINSLIFERIDDKLKAEDDAEVKKALAGPPSGRRSEMEFMAVIDPDLKELKSLRMPPGVPMVLLIAGKHEGGPIWIRSVIDEYSPFIFSSPEGGMTVAAMATHYIHRDEPELVIESIRRVVFPSVKRILETLLEKGDGAAAVRKYRDLRKHYPSEYFRESDLNSLGYKLLRGSDVDGAISLFSLNVEMYPHAANTYDSLAEAYAAKGERALAIKNYKRSLELDPENTNAQRSLIKLTSSPK